MTAGWWLTRLYVAGLVIFGLLAPWICCAQIPIPPLQGHITDQTGTLTQEQKATLEQKLATFEAQKGTQLAVLMVHTTGSEAIEQYALRVAEQWKLGRKKIDDGVVLLVAKEDRAVRIEVGYGLEGVLSDIASKRIISEAILPQFKHGDYFGGIQAGTEQIMHVVTGEPLPAPQGTPGEAEQGFRQIAPLLFIVALAVGGILRSIFGKLGGSMITGVVVTAVAWLIVGTLLYALLAGVASILVTLIGPGAVMRGISGYTAGGHGGWGGGGLRGGGGGFGGGGASGRW
jgi:uncharacterized protein